MRKMLYKRKSLEKYSTFRYSIYRAGGSGYEAIGWASQMPTIVETLFRLIKYYPTVEGYHAHYYNFFAEILGLKENEKNEKN